MSVRVNLLPEATRTKERAGQQRLIAGAVMLLLIAVLGGVWWWANGQVRDAEERLASAELATAQLRAEEAELIAYRDLADRHLAANDLLTASLGDETSVAGVLQDLAAVMPAEAQIDSLSVSLQPPSEERPDVVGAMTLTGRTLTSHAPGVEQVLLELEKVASFGELFLSTSSLDTELEEPVVTYGVEAAIRASARTGRYADGLPGGAR